MKLVLVLLVTFSGLDYLGIGGLVYFIGLDVYG
jgi:hypothetical protein